MQGVIRYIDKQLRQLKRLVNEIAFHIYVE